MKIICLALVLCIAFLSLFFGKLIYDSGVFKKIASHGFQNCRILGSIIGPEDLEYSAKNGIMFVSSDARNESGVSGAIYSFSPASTAAPLKISPEMPFSFHPHGISSFEQNGLTRLFVINHREKEDSVEIFDLDGGKLRFVRSIQDPDFVALNDLQAVSMDSFYATNDHGSSSPILRKLEDYSRIGEGNIVLFDGQKVQKIVTSIGYANGIALSHDGKNLYMAAMLERSIYVFERRIEGGREILRQRPMKIFLGTSPDNIVVAEDGSLWIGAHPKMLSLKAHSKDHALPSPAQVIRIREPNSDRPILEELMSDDGSLITSAVSVAWPLGNKVYLGAIYLPKLLECSRPQVSEGSAPSP